MTSTIANNTPQRIASLKTFLASDEPISIIPVFNYNTKLSDFLVTQRNVGPFVAGEATTVPLWLGIYLRKRNLCRLVAPHWLNVQFLKNVLAYERNANNNKFYPDLPFRYMEISRSIMQTIGAGRSAAHASGGGGAGVLGHEEIPQVEVIRVLLEDISTVRMDKIRRSVHRLSAEMMSEDTERPMSIIDITGIGSAEMAAVKPFLERAFEDHFTIVRSGTDPIPQSRSRRRLPVFSDSSNNEQQQEDQSIGEGDNDDIDANDNADENDDLMEPTEDEETNDDVSRLNVRRYR